MISKQFLVILSLLLLSACAINPVTGKQELRFISDSEEVSLGRLSMPEVEATYGGVYNSKELNDYINKIGQKLARVSHRPQLQYSYKVLNSNIVNAFALPGGFVYITRGLLEKLESECEVAAVLGHETGHVAARHSAKRLEQALGFEFITSFILERSDKSKSSKEKRMKEIASVIFTVIQLGYSREDEYQADELGLEYMYIAGYHPHCMVDMLEILKKEEKRSMSKFEEFFSTHPSTEHRLKEIEELIRKKFPNADKEENLIRNTDEFNEIVKLHLRNKKK